jgi:ATP-dependent Lon protease
MVKENKLLNTKPKRSKRIAESKRKRKVEESSDDSSYSSEESEEYNESEEEMDPVEYRKLLSTLFPSKYMNKKVKATEKMQEIEENLSKKSKKRIPSTDSDSEIDSPKQKSKKNKKQSKKNNDEDKDEDYSEEDVNVEEKTGKKFNIIFTIGNSKNDDSYEDYEDEDDEDWETDEDTENEDETVSTDSDSSEEEEEEEDEEEIKIKNKSKSIQNKEKNNIKNVQSNDEPNDKILENYKSNDSVEPNEELLILLKDLHKKNANKEMIEECIKVCEDKIKNTKKKSDKKMQKHKDKNERIFRKILADKNTMNDFTFFNKMTIEEQIKIIKELREINRITRVEKPYRLTLLESDIPTIFKASAMKKISSLRYMEPGSGEFYKIKNWVDNFMRIPFGKVETLPIHISDGVDTCHNFMEDAKKKLDSAVYGLNDAKMQIMQMLGQLITNPKAIGSAIAIHGPPGTGKTSLVKEGISKILNRPFAFIALGGATDSSFLEGHGYTYEGSTWGKIVQILIDSKCMNPVIYFDELDKISDTPKGEEIAGILTHLTDTSQNSQFHDKYFSEIDFDLSKCLFIFSYNDETKVNPILKDRMYRIQTKGYEKKQKIVISKEHLLPKIREQVKFEEKDIIIPDESIQYMIDNYCTNEDGVRNLKRCLEIIYTKLNLYRLMKPDSNLFEEDMSIKVTFPFTVTKDVVDKLIKKNKDDNYIFRTLYV